MAEARYRFSRFLHVSKPTCLCIHYISNNNHQHFLRGTGFCFPFLSSELTIFLSEFLLQKAKKKIKILSVLPFLGGSHQTRLRMKRKVVFLSSYFVKESEKNQKFILCNLTHFSRIFL